MQSIGGAFSAYQRICARTCVRAMTRQVSCANYTTSNSCRSNSDSSTPAVRARSPANSAAAGLKSRIPVGAFERRRLAARPPGKPYLGKHPRDQKKPFGKSPMGLVRKLKQHDMDRHAASRTMVDSVQSAAATTMLELRYFDKLKQVGLDSPIVAPPRGFEDVPEYPYSGPIELDKYLQVIGGTSAFTKFEAVRFARLCSDRREASPVHDLLERLRNEQLPAAEIDTFVCNASMTAMCRSSDMVGAKELFQWMVDHDITPTSYTYCSLIRGISLIGELDSAFAFVDQLQQHGLQPNTEMMTALISGCLQHRDYNRAWATYKRLRDDMSLKPDIITLTTVMNVFAKQGLAEKAHVVYADMKAKGVPIDLPVTNALLRAFAEAPHEYMIAEDIYKGMEYSGLVPDAYTVEMMQLFYARHHHPMKCWAELLRVIADPAMELTAGNIVRAAQGLGWACKKSMPPEEKAWIMGRLDELHSIIRKHLPPGSVSQENLEEVYHQLVVSAAKSDGGLQKMLTNAHTLVRRVGIDVPARTTVELIRLASLSKRERQLHAVSKLVYPLFDLPKSAPATKNNRKSRRAAITAAAEKATTGVATNGGDMATAVGDDVADASDIKPLDGNAAAVSFVATPDTPRTDTIHASLHVSTTAVLTGAIAGADSRFLSNLQRREDEGEGGRIGDGGGQAMPVQSSDAVMPMPDGWAALTGEDLRKAFYHGIMLATKRKDLSTAMALLTRMKALGLPMPAANSSLSIALARCHLFAHPDDPAQARAWIRDLNAMIGQRVNMTKVPVIAQPKKAHHAPKELMNEIREVHNQKFKGHRWGNATKKKRELLQ